ncbi:MAG: right-handed parallel beta-helix repeat-containing protein [Armatimonadota bacterium]
MNNRIIVALCFVLLVLISSPTLGIVYVAPNGSGSGTSWANPLGTIQAAIDIAAGDQVWVKHGVYYELIMLKDNVQVYGGFTGTETMLSQRPPFPRSSDDPNCSVIDGSGCGSVVTALAGVTSSAVIDGFTITDGLNYSTGGGGVLCVSSSPVIRWCKIVDNIADVGAGMYLRNASPTIESNTIACNRADFFGGGISMEFCSKPTINDNTICNNDGGYMGGGIDVEGDSAPSIMCNRIDSNIAGFGGGIYTLSNCAAFQIRENAIVNNTSITGGGGGIYCSQSSPIITFNFIEANASISDGGGIYCYYRSSPIVTNNVIAFNSARQYGGGVFAGQYSIPQLTNNTIARNATPKRGGGIALITGCASPISNNLVAYNTTGIYSYLSKPVLRKNDFFNAGANYTGITAGLGDIQAFPNFVDSAAGDFRIQQPTPCYNAGWNGAPYMTGNDINGYIRIQAGTIDIGAYELPPVN